jgi:hypothetical protein
MQMIMGLCKILQIYRSFFIFLVFFGTNERKFIAERSNNNQSSSERAPGFPRSFLGCLHFDLYFIF